MNNQNNQRGCGGGEDDSYDDRAPLGTNGRPHYVTLPIDDICPGKYVTPCRGPFQHNMQMFNLGPVMVTTEDRRLHGYPMQVLAVNLPYVSVKLLTPAPVPMLLAYNVHDVQFREVSLAYVDSLVGGVVDQGWNQSGGAAASTNPHPFPGEISDF